MLNLGFWQVRRLAWKNDIIASIEARLESESVALPDEPTPEDSRYLLVRESGEILPGEIHVYTSRSGDGVGYRVIVPFETAAGRRILLDRGFVPIADKDAERYLGPIEVEGALDWPRETDSYTADPDLEKNVWLARNVPKMADHLETEPVLLVTSASSDPNQPVPMPVTVNIRNNHFEYAVTWFLLALVWAVMTVYLLWRIKRADQ